MKKNFLLIILYAVVFATGGAGLIYQVTWQKYLSRLLGSDAIATAIILAAFLGGLSLGYYVCGKITTRVKNHFKAYAVLEGIIGAWGLSFPWIFNVTDHLTMQWSFSPPALIIFQGFIVSVILLGIPTICMGGTIPFLTRGISRNINEATSVHASVYAINTAGAFLGTLLAGFYLIPVYGLPLTVTGTAVINILAFLFFYLLPVTQSEPAPAPKPAPAEPAGMACPAKPVVSPRALCCIAFLSGFYVMTLENVLIRITGLSFGSSSYSFTMIVAAFILSIAVGSHLVGRRPSIPRTLLFTNQLAITLLLCLIYVTLDTWPYWAHLLRISFQSNIVGFWMYYGSMFLLLALVLLLPVSFMGATVPILFHELKRDLASVGKHSGQLFSWNTLGNLTGSLVGGIVLYYFFNNGQVFLTAICLAAASACLVAFFLSKKLFFFTVTGACIAVQILAAAPLYNQLRFTWGNFLISQPTPYSFEGPRSFFEKKYSNSIIRSYKDSPSGTTAVLETVTNNVAGLSILVNGKSDSSTFLDVYTMKLSAHIPALLTRKKENAFVIGLGTGMTVGELSLYPDVKHIEVAEISEAVIEALPYFKQYTYDVGRDPRVQIRHGDAFRILRRSNRKWDIVVSEPSNPWVTGVDQLFTEEFYKLIKTRLTDEGMLLQWIHIYFNSPEMLGMVINTVMQYFPQVHVFLANGGDLLLACSNRQITLDDIARAEQTLMTTEPVRTSLGAINITSMDALLIRELYCPEFVVRNWSGYGLQSMDNPRLHYIAGKNAFLGSRIPHNVLLGNASTAYAPDYLLYKKNPTWLTSLRLEKTTIDRLLLSLKYTAVENAYVFLTEPLSLRAYLGDERNFPIDPNSALAANLPLIKLCMNASPDDKAWQDVHLAGATIRQKAEALLQEINTTRNWIVPYPLDGLKALLAAGITEESTALEKNWCILQLAALLHEEGTGPARIAQITKQLARDDTGAVIADSDVKALLENAQHTFPAAFN